MATTQALDIRPNAPKPKRKGYWGGKFLFFSITFHLLFGVGAAYYVIQTYGAKKLTFKGGAPSINPAKKLADHKVQMAKKQKSMSAPAPAKRVTTSAPSKITMPEMPIMPASVVTPTQITGIGGIGNGFGMGNGGNGNGNGDGGGGFMAPFGSKTAKSGALIGTYYDFKHTRGGQESKDSHYGDEIKEFVRDGWHESKLSKYYKGPQKLYATQIFFPTIDTSEAPKAFGSTLSDTEGGKWIAIYKGQVSPPESGTYYFVGAGDDNIMVWFDGKLILDNCEHIQSQVQSTAEYHYGDLRNVFKRSQPVNVTAGQFYDIKILIGDDIPTKNCAFLLVEKQGVNYGRDGGGGPILPIFALEKAVTAGPPAHLDDGPLWRGRSTSTSLLDP